MTPWLLLAHGLLLWQSIPFPGVGNQVHGGGAVTISNHGVTSVPSTCTNGTDTCAQSGGDTPATVGATGDTLFVAVHVATNAGAVSPMGCTVTASDGTNTYTFLTGAFNAGVSSNTVPIWPFYAKNATAGTYNLSFSISGIGCDFYYVQGIFWVDLAGASTTAPIDTSVTNATTGSQAITSAGNVTNAGEVGLCLASWNTAITGYTGAFSLLDSGLTGNGNADVVGPTAGSPITCTATGGAAQYGMSILAITP